MHAWFECIEWLDDLTPIPDEALLRAPRVEFDAVPDDAIDRLLPEFYAAIQRPETRRVFERDAIGDVESICRVPRGH